MRPGAVLLAVWVVLLGPSLGVAASSDAVKWNNFGAELLKQGKVNEARANFQYAVTLDPNFAQAQFNLGYALEQLEQIDEAIAAYQRATTLDPSHATAFNNLGVLLSRKGQNEEAIRTLEQGLKIDPSHATLQKNLESVRKNHDILKERERQIESARQEAQGRPNDPQAAYKLARALAWYERSDEALEWLARAVDLGYPDPGSWKFDPALVRLRTDPRFMRMTDGR